MNADESGSVILINTVLYVVFSLHSFINDLENPPERGL